MPPNRLEEIARQDSPYHRALEAVRQWVTEVWQNPVVYYQLDHGPTHAHRVCQYLDQLSFGPDGCRMPPPTPAEAFVLLAAAYLHDVGMQLGWSEAPASIPRARGALTGEDLETIRRLHAQTSAAVIRSWKTALPASLARGLSDAQKDILCGDLNEVLAFVAEYHNRPYAAHEIRQKAEGFSPAVKNRVRIALLAGWLQAADALHMDHTRVTETILVDALDLWRKGKGAEFGLRVTDLVRMAQAYFVDHVAVDWVGTSGVRIRVLVRVRDQAQFNDARVLIERYESRLQRRDGDALTLIQSESAGAILFGIEPPQPILDPTVIPVPDDLLQAPEPPPPTHSTCDPPVPTFVGREELVDEAMRSLVSGTCRWITFHGPSGIGKTQAALKLAQALCGPERALALSVFVPLEAATKAADVPDRVKTALIQAGFRLEAADDLPTVLRRVAQTPCLLVLDNAEDVLEVDRQAAVAVLESIAMDEGPHRLVVTTKAPTHSPHEAPRRVPPLRSAAEGRAEDQDLWARLTAGIDPQPGDDLRAGELLGQLEGIPLAIYLSACRWRATGSLAAILEDWHQSGPHGMRVGPERTRRTDLEFSLQRNLALLDESRPLDQEARRVLSLLALLPAGSADDLARDLLGPDWLAAVTRLCDVGLGHNRAGRWGLLEPIRRFALASLDTSPWHAPLEEWLIARARTADRAIGWSGSVRALAWFRAEMANLHAVWDAAAQRGQPAVVGALGQALGDAYLWLNVPGAQERLARASEAARSIADTLGRANCIKSRGDVLAFLNRHEEALGAYDAAQPLYEQIGATLGRANCIKGRGDVLAFLKRHEEALEAYDAAQPLYEEIGHTLGRANCISCRGDVLADLKRHEEALEAYDAAQPLYEQIGDTLGRANCIRSRARVHSETGDGRAGAEFDEAFRLYGSIGDVYSQAGTLVYQARHHRRSSEPDRARECYGRALGLFREIKYQPGIDVVTEELGEL